MHVQICFQHGANDKRMTSGKQITKSKYGSRIFPTLGIFMTSGPCIPSGICLHDFLKATNLRNDIEKDVSSISLYGLTFVFLLYKDTKAQTFEKCMLQQSCWIISWSVFSFKSDFSKVDGPNVIRLRCILLRVTSCSSIMGLIRFFEQKEFIGSSVWSFPSPSRWSVTRDTAPWSVWSSYWRSTQNARNPSSISCELSSGTNCPPPKGTSTTKISSEYLPSVSKNPIESVVHVAHHDHASWYQEIDRSRDSVEEDLLTSIHTKLTRW